MTLDDRLENVAVIGAAGKMGSGIALLMAQEMTLQKLKPGNGEKNYELHLIDVHPQQLTGLMGYLQKQAVKLAERNISELRELYRERNDLVENQEIIQQFVDDLFLTLRPAVELTAAQNSRMVFEAIVENADVKISVLSKLKEICPPDAFFFTNTSSIPISLLDEKAGLNGRIIGYHFYNPPAVQKLVELISPPSVSPELREISLELGKRLRKTIVPANDKAGFIGNGHFMRDGLYALSEQQKLKGEFSGVQAAYIVNRITQDFLIRPMGIFQLIDYVGIDVFRSILETMNPYYPGENLHSEIIDRMTAQKVLGGQKSDGSQKDGFLKYEKNRPVGIYDMEKNAYVLFDEGDWKAEADTRTGDPPQGFLPWKQLLRDSGREEKLAGYFGNLKAGKSLGARIAVAYLKRSKEIGEQLVRENVAGSPEDVNKVLLNGFYHLYGPVNDYV